MKSITDPADKVATTGETPERGHEAWLRVKVERGLAQARDRDAMIPAAQLLCELGLER
jgi:hypothetical protein